jgi:hypothetical protein
VSCFRSAQACTACEEGPWHEESSTCGLCEAEHRVAAEAERTRQLGYNRECEEAVALLVRLAEEPDGLARWQIVWKC